MCVEMVLNQFIKPTHPWPCPTETHAHTSRCVLCDAAVTSGSVRNNGHPRGRRQRPDKIHLLFISTSGWTRFGPELLNLTSEGRGPGVEPGPDSTSGLWASGSPLSFILTHPSSRTHAHTHTPNRTLTGRVDRSWSRHVSSPKQRLRTRIGSDGADAQNQQSPAENCPQAQSRHTLGTRSDFTGPTEKPTRVRTELTDF